MSNFSSPKAILFTTVMVDLIGFGIIIPLIALYGAYFGGTTLELAILSSIYSLMQFIFAPVWGKLSDRLGRRPILLSSSAGLAVSYLLFGLSSSISMLIIARAFAGIFAANISAAQAYMADISPVEKRTEAMGFLGAAFGMGFVIGPPLGALSSVYFGLQAPGLVAFAICFLNFIATYFRLPESLPLEKRGVQTRIGLLKSLQQSKKIVFGKPIIISLLVIGGLLVFFFSSFEQTLSLAVKINLNVDTTDAVRKMGIIMMFMGLQGIFMQGYLLSKIKKKWNDSTLLYVGIFTYAMSTLVLTQCESFTQYVIVCLFISSASSLINPSISGMLSKSVDQTNQGLVMGVNQGFSSLARVFGPFIGIHLFYYSSTAPFLLASIGSLVLLLFARVEFSRNSLLGIVVPLQN